MVNIDWLDTMNECVANFLPAGVSNYSPGIIEWREGSSIIYPFKFNNSWTLIKGFMDKVKEVWEQLKEGIRCVDLLLN